MRGATEYAMMSAPTEARFPNVNGLSVARTPTHL
jgi:hypothetical protein